MVLTIVTSALSLVAAGGWWVNYREKKEIEQNNAMSGEVDLTEKILQKYQQGVLSVMSGNNGELRNKLDNIEEQLATLQRQTERNCSEIQLLGEYLNGEFKKYKKERER